MSDVFSKRKRSEIMRRVKGRNTTPELEVRSILHSTGLRFRINFKTLPGKPDIVLRKYNTVIFVNGCFWHGHTNCKHASLPKSNTEYWQRKIFGNRDRDLKNVKVLRKMGWNVIQLWECKIPKLVSDHRKRGLLIKKVKGV